MFEASSGAALERLNAFLPKAGRDYTRDRNFDLGPQNHHNTSVLSPYLRHRLITEPEVVQAVLKHYALAEAEKFIQEVIWRTYWKGWLEMRPQVWQAYVRTLQADQRQYENWEVAIAGTTGIECFDFWCRELKDTGYLHNHARMWFASIWIFTLGLPWYLGADFFLQHLLDGDAASNTLSWRWVAGLQTRGKYYLATAENIAKYTQGRFNPESQLATIAQRPEDDVDLTPQPLSFIAYPEGLSPASTALIIFEEDLSLENLVLDSLPLVVVIRPECLAKMHQRSPQVLTFQNRAIADQLSRLSPKTIIEVRTEQELENLSDQLVGNQVKSVVYAKPFVGPWTAIFDNLNQQLSEVDIRSYPLSRPWDTKLFPYAKKGFFPFKKQVLPPLTQYLDV